MSYYIIHVIVHVIVQQWLLSKLLKIAKTNLVYFYSNASNPQNVQYLIEMSFKFIIGKKGRTGIATSGTNSLK